MQTSLLWIAIMTVSCLWVSGYTQEGKYPFLLEEDNDSDIVIPINISMAENGEHNAYSSDNTMSPRHNAPLTAEWARIRTLSHTHTKESSEYSGPRIASVELTENTLSTLTTRTNTLSIGIHFRLIVFRKSGNNYVFQSAADYTSSSTSSPVLKQGKLFTRSGTIQVINYSFNTTTALRGIPASYTYNSTKIDISDMNNDFMIYDSGDITNVNSPDYNPPVTFRQKLYKLAISINVTSFTSDTISGYTGVYVKQGGSLTSWVIGSSTMATNINNTASSNSSINLTITIRIALFAGIRTITVHFDKLTVGNVITNNADSIDITSTQGAQLKEGMSYTMKIQFERSPGINVPAGNVNLSNLKKACINDDRQKLSRLVFVGGNLKSTGASNNYVRTTNKEFSYYHQWKKGYNGSNINPCVRLNPTTYDSSWRLPTRNELEGLRRYNNVKKVSNGVNGVWFLNAATGTSLLLGGWRNNNLGVTAEDWPGACGQYFTGEPVNTNECYRLDISSDEDKTDVNNTLKRMTYQTRCVKGPKL